MKKRIISLLLALSLVLSIGVVYAEEEAVVISAFSSEEDNIAIEHLQLLGLTDKTDIDPKAAITRGELANVAANMLGISIDTIGTGVSTNITDVNENPYGKQINALVSYKILSGVNSYQYLPDNTVRYNEALKVLLCTLGYGEEAQARGGYPSGYVKLASILKIAIGRIRNHDAISWGEFARLVEEFYNIPLQDVVISGNEMIFSQKEGKTFLSHYHDIVKVSGTIKDNGYTARSEESKVGVKNVLIGDTVVGKGNTDIENKIGAKVECYAKKDSSKLTAIFYTVDNLNVDVIEIKASEIKSATVDKISCRVNGTTQVYNISPYADVIYNGTTYPAFDGELLKIENGKITLYDDNKTYGGYDLLVIEEYETFVVSSTSAVINTEDGVTIHTGDKIITGTLGEMINLDEYETYFVYNDKYEELPLGRVQPGYVASVYKSLTKGLCKIIFSNNNIDGAVTSIETDDRTYYYIEETKYELSHSLMSRINANVVNTFVPEVGTKYEFMLDVEGNIAGYKALVEGKQFGYVTAISNKSADSFGDERTYLRVATAQGGFATLRTAKKITLNYAETKIPGKDLVNEPAFYVDGNTANDFKPQLIQFEANTAGDIVALNTATTELNDYGYNATKFSMDKEIVNSNYRSDGRFFGEGELYNYYISKNAQVFIVPASLREDEFNVVTASTFPASADARYNVKLYEIDETLAANVAVVTSSESIVDEAPNMYFFVEKAYYTLEGDDEMHMRIQGYLGETHKEYVEYEAGYMRRTLGEVKPGDILRLYLKDGRTKFNSGGTYVAHDRMIVKAERITSAEEIFEKKTGFCPDATGSGINYYYGPIYGRNESSTAILINKDTALSEPAQRIEDIKRLPTQSAQGGQFIYNLTDKVLTPVKYNDIVGSSTVYEDGTFDPDWGSILFIQFYGQGKGSKLTVLIREK